MTRKTTNRNKHINEASKQTFANIIAKISCKYMQNMSSNWKICLNIINISTYDKSLNNLSKTNEIVQFTTCTNFLIWCQQTTITISKCNANSFGPVCQLWSVNMKFMRDSKPHGCVQQHKSLKVTHNAANKD